ncbi:Protein SODIUM POTASSIUM ROOT DEFECTIVE 1 [Linum perenne]
MNDVITAAKTTTTTATKKMIMKGFMCQQSGTTSTSTISSFICGANDLPNSSAIVPMAAATVKHRRRQLLQASSSVGSYNNYSRLQKKQEIQSQKTHLITSSEKMEKIDDVVGRNKYGSPPHGGDGHRRFQVVTMRVSLHCQGCAAKVKRHLSKMEGVTSFSIEMETERVRVMGYVSPLVLLQSVSKVKRAELWSDAGADSASE